MCRANLEPDSSGTRFRRRLEHFYSKPESGVHVTEMTIDDWSMIIARVSVCFLVVSFITNYEYIVCATFSHVYFRRPKFLFHTHLVRKTGTENWRQKMESIYGRAGFWSVCHNKTVLHLYETNYGTDFRVIHWRSRTPHLLGNH